MNSFFSRAAQLAACITVIVLLAPKGSFAQQPTSLRNNATITLKLDETGKITNAPAGFQLREGCTYNYVIEVAPPDKQERALIKYFKEQLLATFNRLSDPSDSATIVLKKMFLSAADFDAYNKEFKTLYDQLDEDPAVAQTNLASAGTSLYHLNGVPFLKRALFDQVFNVTAEIGGQKVSATANYNQTATIRLSNAPSIDRSNLVIRVNDLKKQFLIAYYNEARQRIAPFNTFLKNVSPNNFYNTAIKKELKKLIETKVDLVKKANASKTYAQVCIQPWDDLQTAYTQNELIQQLNTDWVKRWTWYSTGEIRFNPYDFTDANRLDLPDGYDKTKAKEMNEYVRKSMDRLKANGSQDKISIALFDSLNRQLDNAKDLYTFDKVNALAKKANQDKFTAFQQGKKVTDSLTFIVQADPAMDDTYLKSYNAARSLLKSKKDYALALPLDTRIQLMAYNVMSVDTFKVTSKDIDITDESAASKNVSEVASGLSLAFTQGALAVPVIQAVKQGLQGTVNAPKLTIQPATAHDAQLEGDQTLYQYRLEAQVTGHMFKIANYADGHPMRNPVDITADIDNELAKYLPVDCAQPIIDRVWANLASTLNHQEKRQRATFDDYINIEKSFYKDVNQQINDIIETTLNQIAAANKAKIQSSTPLLEVAAYMLAHGNYILPPHKLELKNAADKPIYVTTYKELDAKSSPKLINLSLTYAYKDKSQGNFTRLDRVKQAPPHWISPSLGLAYVFDKFSRSNVNVTNGVITDAPDEDQARVVAGVNIYPVPIMYVDDRFITNLRGKALVSRFSIFAGCSFPQPLYNPHLGISIEPWPSVKLTYGWHWYRKTETQVVNDQISEQHGRYYYNSPFVSLTFDPVKFVALISSIKL